MLIDNDKNAKNLRDYWNFIEGKKRKIQQRASTTAAPLIIDHQGLNANSLLQWRREYPIDINR